MLTEINARFLRPADRIDSWRTAVSENLVHVECRLSSLLHRVYSTRLPDLTVC